MLITITWGYSAHPDFSDLPASLTASAKRPKVEYFLRDKVQFGDSTEGGSRNREINTVLSRRSMYLNLSNLK